MPDMWNTIQDQILRRLPSTRQDLMAALAPGVHPHNTEAALDEMIAQGRVAVESGVVRATAGDAEAQTTGQRIKLADFERITIDGQDHEVCDLHLTVAADWAGDATFSYRERNGAEHTIRLSAAAVAHIGRAYP